jgi:ubiquinone/menaquinone biosynthesis C-methylase UbiE
MLSLNYFNHIIKNSSKISNREELGNREVETLFKIIKLYGHEIEPSGKILLDLGCGDKHLENSVKKRNINYYGLDITDVNFEYDKLPFEDNKIDIIVFLAVIEHISNPDNLLNEVYRILKPGGIIYITTPNWYYDYRTFYNDPTHVKAYNPVTLERILEMYSFQNPNTFPGLRCKHEWYYKGKYRFKKAKYLLPFRGSVKFAPNFLKGKSTSIIAIAKK